MDGSGAAYGRSVAIIGGGFTGACIALHLARSAYAGQILVFDPRPVLGLGLAYATTDDAHRLNAPAQRMSMYPDDADHFVRWIAATGACDGDAGALFGAGKLFPRRAVFGAYIAAQMAPLLADGRIRHVPVAVEDLDPSGAGWSVRGADGRCHQVGMAVLATGHAPPAVPAALAAVAAHPGFIADAWRRDDVKSIGREADVLIVGTGLTMADMVASLDAAGHAGRILAISRRGQMPREHAAGSAAYSGMFSPPATALGLLRLVRARVARAAAEGIGWQCVFDALRAEAEAFWAHLPAAERRRLLRHAKPFWETHRYRLPPPTAARLRQRMDARTLRIEAAKVAGARPAGARIEVDLRARGAAMAVTASFDAVILTIGPGRIAEAPCPLLRTLCTAGLLSPDATGQGIDCDEDGAACRDHQAPPLFVAGPLSRGRFAEITGVPEISRQAAKLATYLAALATAAASKTRFF
jgi:uncharacterized NAD(P)/FAD-binding protein YdhS